MAYDMSDGTRAAMLTFGQLLARDIAPLQARAAGGLSPEEAGFLRQGRTVLAALDSLDVGPDEDGDRDMERMRLAPGTAWLLIAESGNAWISEYIAHVLHFFDRGGYSGGRFVRQLLMAVDAADDEMRDALAIGFPEYVGLWRAAAQTPDGLARLAGIASAR